MTCDEQSTKMAHFCIQNAYSLGPIIIFYELYFNFGVVVQRLRQKGGSVGQKTTSLSISEVFRHIKIHTKTNVL